jgi:hypothetical protein
MSSYDKILIFSYHVSIGEKRAERYTYILILFLLMREFEKKISLWHNLFEFDSISLAKLKLGN